MKYFFPHKVQMSARNIKASKIIVEPVQEGHIFCGSGPCFFFWSGYGSSSCFFLSRLRLPSPGIYNQVTKDRGSILIKELFYETCILRPPDLGLRFYKCIIGSIHDLMIDVQWSSTCLTSCGIGSRRCGRSTSGSRIP